MDDIRSVVSVDVLALAYDPERARVDLGLHRRDRPPFEGELALPGVVLHSGESLASAATRALGKLTDARALALGQLHTFDEPLRDPRGPSLSVAMFAVLEPHESPRAVWTRLDGDLPSLAFDHADIVRDCLPLLAERLWRDMTLTRALVPARFTTADAVRITQALTGRDPHRANLNRTLDALPGIVRAGTVSQGPGRPTALRSFRD